MATGTFETELLDPVEPPAPLCTQLAPRLSTLEGRTIGLLENSKFNSKELLDYLAEVLEHDFGVKEVLRRSKSSSSLPAPDEVYDELAALSDAVVTGIGD